MEAHLMFFRVNLWLNLPSACTSRMENCHVEPYDSGSLFEPVYLHIVRSDADTSRKVEPCAVIDIPGECRTDVKRNC